MLDRIFGKISSNLINLSHLIQIRGHLFYSRCIDQNSLVVDLGANKGDFSLQIVQAFGCKCYALEASPGLYEAIPKDQHIKKFNLAVCKKNGPISFYLSSNLEASTIVNDIKKAWDSFGTIIVDGITLEDFLIRNKISSVDLLKIDIEGAEIEVLDSISDDTLRTIKQITVEFHQFCKGINCGEDITRIKKRFNNLGFICIAMRLDNTDVLFINDYKINFKWLERFYVKLLISFCNRKR
ncbi:MAG: FkbM family methyltransferase [Candidatus Omnitrophica bacterium]|nr:FkbM family methyltransferase [Candidatus Omnitrophota bacterium]